MRVRDQLHTALAQAEHQVERIQAELDFAAELCALHPERAADWQPRLETAHRLVGKVLNAGQMHRVDACVQEAENELAPLRDTAKEYTVHCIGHAHIDMNWMWSWPETVAVTVDTFATVLRLLQEYPGFLFSQSQASTYQIIQQHRPDLLEQIVEQVKAGRWEVTASHWVEGDKNLASAESLCRHLLYTRDYMRQLFGLEPEDVPVDWAPDTFGHALTVPTYLRRGAVKYVYMHRPGGSGPQRPWLFWWQGPDGSRVLVRNDSSAGAGYNGQVGPEAVLRDWRLFTRQTGLKDHMFVYGVGDHGGGPTRRDIEQILDMDTWPVFPNMRFGRVASYMDRVASGAGHLPVLQGELNFEFAGCYTSQALIKRANRHGENRLLEAETTAALATAADPDSYPRDILVQGWRDVLFSQFHDILPGSGVHDTRTYTHGLFQTTMAATGQIETRALRALAGRIDTTGEESVPAGSVPASRIVDSVGAGVGFQSAEGSVAASDQSDGTGVRPFVLFNSMAADRSEVVRATLWRTRGSGRPLHECAFTVHTATGKSAPVQVLGGGYYWGHEYAEVAFPARIPGLGYATYRIQMTDQPGLRLSSRAWQLGSEHHCRYSRYERGEEGLENDLVSLRLDPETGGLSSLRDKNSGLELIDARAGTAPLEFVIERPHGMTAWLIDHQEGPAEYPVVRALRRTLRGPYEAAIEVDLAVRESEFTLTYAVRAGEPRVHVQLRGTWFQRGTPATGVPALSYRLPLALAGARARYEVPFGSIRRSQHQREEVPALRWAQVSGRTAADREATLLLANDCKYGHSLDERILRLTLIRSSYDPDILPEIGQHEVSMTLRPAAGVLSVDAAIREGQTLNHPLRVIGTDVHAGPLRRTGQFMRIMPAAVSLGALKQAESGDGFIVRLYNPGDQDVEARLELDEDLLGAVRQAVEVDLLERPVEKRTLAVSGNRVVVPIPAHGIATVMIQTQRS